MIPPAIASYIKIVIDNEEEKDENDGQERDNLCHLLMNTINIMAGTEMAWAVSSVLFRFIMVKYAERGLVEGGVVSRLFNILYMCLALTLTIILILFTLVNNYKSPETAFIAICLNHNFKMSKNWHTYSIGISLFAIGLVSLLIMGFSSAYILKSKSKNGYNPPAIFGRFQRNILTFKETLVYHTIYFFSFISIGNCRETQKLYSIHEILYSNHDLL